MILVDTSVLVDFLGGRESKGTRHLERLVREEAGFCLAPLIVQEVLQGARTESEWRTLKEYLTTQIIVDAADPVHAAVEAARIYFECRRRGLTVRSAADCYIAHLAIEHGFALLHDDRDFDMIRKVRPLVTLPDSR